MGFWSRLGGEVERTAPIKAAVLGTGVEADRLRRAYETAGLEVAAGDGEEAIRAPGLAAAEIVASPAERTELAAACLRAGLFTSVAAPPTTAEVEDLEKLSRAHGVGLRFRLLPFYYPPIREARRLMEEDRLGLPISLKLQVRRGKGTEFPDPFDPAAWIREHELGFFALDPWLMGKTAAVHGRLETKRTGAAPASSVICLRHAEPHRYSYLQLDCCPSLHVRTFHEPVHRNLELTAVGGVIFVTRGEGQLRRQPALIVRGKSTTTAFEMVPDDWSNVYDGLARETISVVRDGGKVTADARVTREALRLLDRADESARAGDEVAA